MGDMVRNGAGSSQNGHKINGHKAPVATSVPKIPPAPLAKTNKAKKPPSALAKLMALRKASKRPLPTEMGDGSYRAVANRPTLRDDLGSITKSGQ